MTNKMTNRICYIIYIKNSMDNSLENVDALYFTDDIDTSMLSRYPNLRFAFSANGTTIYRVDQPITFDDYTNEYFSDSESTLSISFTYY